MVGIHAGRHDVVADYLLGCEALVGLVLQLGSFHLCLGGSKVCLGILYTQLVFCLVNDEQGLTFGNPDAVLEIDLADNT